MLHYSCFTASTEGVSSCITSCLPVLSWRRTEKLARLEGNLQRGALVGGDVHVRLRAFHRGQLAQQGDAAALNNLVDDRAGARTARQ